MAWETGFWVVVAVVGTVLTVFAEAVVLRPLDWLYGWILRGEHISPWKQGSGPCIGRRTRRRDHCRGVFCDQRPVAPETVVSRVRWFWHKPTDLSQRFLEPLAQRRRVYAVVGNHDDPTTCQLPFRSDDDNPRRRQGRPAGKNGQTRFRKNCLTRHQPTDILERNREERVDARFIWPAGAFLHICYYRSRHHFSRFLSPFQFHRSPSAGTRHSRCFEVVAAVRTLTQAVAGGGKAAFGRCLCSLSRCGCR